MGGYVTSAENADYAHCPAIAADHLNLPFSNRSADVALSDGVAHRTEDPQRTFLGVLLNDGGYPYGHDDAGGVHGCPARKRTT